MRSMDYVKKKKRGLFRRVSFWVTAAILMLLLIVAASSTGFAGVLMMLGLFMFVTALYTVITKRGSWIGLPSRKMASFALAGSFAAIVAATSMSGSSIQEPEPRDHVVTAEAAVAVPAGNDATQPEAENPEAVAEEQRLADEQAAAAVQLAAVEKAAADKKAADKVIADKKAADKAAAAKKAEAKKTAEKAAAVKKAEAKKVADRKVAQAKVAADRRAAKAVPTPRKTSPAPSQRTGTVHPGSFCSGGTGVTKTGRAMVCGTAKDGRLRWKSA